MQSDHPLVTFRLNQDPPLSPEALADFLGVTAPTVSRWISGKRKIGSELLPSISAKTGIPAKELRPDLAELLKDEAAE